MLRKRKRMNEHLARRKALHRKICKCECGLENAVVNLEGKKKKASQGLLTLPRLNISFINFHDTQSVFRGK